MPASPENPEHRAETAVAPPGRPVETIELLEEVLRVEKRRVETGRVRVSLTLDTEQRPVRETLRSRRVDVERVAVGQRLEAGAPVPETRTVGNVLIVPVVEEVLVVEKRLVVTEELHIRILDEDEQVEQLVPLRRQHATVERLAPDAPDRTG